MLILVHAEKYSHIIRSASNRSRASNHIVVEISVPIVITWLGALF